jgi:uroporphyrin-III C-methyltransferase
VSSAKQKGKLYLIGAGPGDPELLTLKAVRALGECDVILHDRLVSRKVLSYARPGAQILNTGKHKGRQEHTQSEIFAMIKEHARAGKTVGRLKGGDPMVFGRGGEEWAFAVEHGIDAEVIPGVTSAVAVPELAGIPLTYRGISQSFAVITGHCREGLAQTWANYARIDTLVILMGVQNRSFIARSLMEAGRPAGEPVAFIENGTNENERVIESTLGAVAQSEVDVSHPAIFVVGTVVGLRNRLYGSNSITARPCDAMVMGSEIG